MRDLCTVLAAAGEPERASEERHPAAGGSEWLLRHPAALCQQPAAREEHVHACAQAAGSLTAAQDAWPPSGGSE